MNRFRPMRWVVGGVTVLVTVVLVLALGVGQRLQGQPTAMRFFRGNSGLVDNHIQAVADQGDTLVVATPNGVTLVRPDRLESWRRGDRGFPDASARAVTVAGGQVWVGTHGHGLARLEGDRWRTFSQSDLGLPDSFVEALAALGNRLFIGTREGLCVYTGLLCETIPLPGPVPLAIRGLAADGAQVVAATAMGAFRITAANAVTPVNLGVYPEPAVDAVALDNGTIYAAGEFGLVAVAPDGRRQAWGRDRFPTARFHAVWPTAGGNVLCGTARGLFLARAGGAVEEVPLPEVAGPVPVTALGRSDGTFWVGTGGLGILRLPGEPGAGSLVMTGTGSPPPAGGSPLRDVVVFPPPKTDPGRPPAGTPPGPAVGGSPVAGGSPAAGGEGSGRVRPYWTMTKKQRMTNLSFYQDILPVMVKECLPCHTTGTGKYFPLNDPVVVLAYFRKAKLDRFMSFCDEGGGMAGKVDPHTIKMLQMWIMFGGKE